MSIWRRSTKGFIVMALALASFNVVIGQVVMAISPADLSSILNESELYNAAACTATTPSTASGALPSSVPAAFATIFETAASQYNVPPALVAAIFMEENGLENGGSWPDPTSESWPTSTSGAEGPFQFLSSTFQGEEASGKTDINNLTDGAYAAANYLASNGGKLPTPDLQTAISTYNHSQSYVDAVTKLYNQLGGASSGAGGASNAGATIDVSSVAKKYNLQSAIVTQVGGSTVGSYQSDQPPVTPASTMKLVIVDTLLQSKVDLTQVIPVTPALVYDNNGGPNDLPGSPSSITVGAALDAALKYSSNAGANVLVKAMGGVSGFTAKAHGLGYTNTTMDSYYKDGDHNSNQSTIADEANAMDHLLTATGGDYGTAQKDMQWASGPYGADGDNYYGVQDEANKWAGTTQVAGNVGEFSIAGQQYIIGLYINKQVPGAVTDPNNDINQATNALAALAQNRTETPASAAASTGGCCPDSGDTSAAVPGDTSAATTAYQSGLSGPYIVEQFAINVLKDLAQKKGVPTSQTVTQQHVTALVAWALVEGGNINNSSLFNLYNTGQADPGFTAGSHTSDGLGSYVSFDAGVEETTRTLDDGGYNPMLRVLLDQNSTAEAFGTAESQTGTTPGTKEWAAAAVAEGPSTYFSSSWAPALANVRSDYKDTAGLLIGAPPDSLTTHKTDPSLLQFSGAGPTGTAASGSSCTSGTPSPDAAGIVAEALSLSWPDASHGTTPTPAYQAAYTQYDPGGAGVADCGSFVATVMHATGADKNYRDSGTGAQYTYVNSAKNSAGQPLYTVQTLTSLDQLQPGDIVIEGGAGGIGVNGHTWIYVGKQPNGDYSASASEGQRAANLDQDPPNLDTGGGAPIYARLN